MHLPSQVMDSEGSVVQDMSRRRSPLTVRSLEPGRIYKFTVTSVIATGLRSEASEVFEQATRK